MVKGRLTAEDDCILRALNSPSSHSLKIDSLCYPSHSPLGFHGNSKGDTGRNISLMFIISPLAFVQSLFSFFLYLCKFDSWKLIDA